MDRNVLLCLEPNLTFLNCVQSRKMNGPDVESAIVDLYDEGRWQEILDLNATNSFLPWIWPSDSDLKFIGESVRDVGGDVVISVGCGSGLLEWLLNKSTGIDVLGIELDRSWWTSKYAKVFIPMHFLEEPGAAHRAVAAASGTAVLLFCYFNNRKAFKSYMESFAGQCFIVIGPGPGKTTYTVPEPFSLPGDSDRNWRLSRSREIRQSGDYIAVYVRT